MKIHSALLTTLLASTALSIACGDPETEPSPSPADLRAALGEDARPVGVAVDQETGQRFVLDAAGRIVELHRDGTITELWTANDSLPELTDLCALGGGRFIAAADGDGYIVDIAAGAARQHFCLEPGWDPGFDEPPAEPDPNEPPPVQLQHTNRSVACDLASGLIYGQPQTLPMEGEPTPIRSEVASYTLSTGEDLDWMQLPEATYQAGGMTLLGAGRLLLGAGAELSTFDFERGELVSIGDVSAHGIERIDALAIDEHSGALLVLDGVRGQLVEISLETLAIE